MITVSVNKTVIVRVLTDIVRNIAIIGEYYILLSTKQILSEYCLILKEEQKTFKISESSGPMGSWAVVTISVNKTVIFRYCRKYCHYWWFPSVSTKQCHIFRKYCDEVWYCLIISVFVKIFSKKSKYCQTIFNMLFKHCVVEILSNCQDIYLLNILELCFLHLAPAHLSCVFIILDLLIEADMFLISCCISTLVIVIWRILTMMMILVMMMGTNVVMMILMESINARDTNFLDVYIYCISVFPPICVNIFFHPPA